MSDGSRNDTLAVDRCSDDSGCIGQDVEGDELEWIEEIGLSMQRRLGGTCSVRGTYRSTAPMPPRMCVHMYKKIHISCCASLGWYFLQLLRTV